MSNDSGYVGSVVAGGILSAIPLFANLNPEEIFPDLILLALCGGVGAFIAVIGDRPMGVMDLAFRLSGGVFFCFLFGGLVARRLGFAADQSGLLFVFGGLGFASWYLIGALSRGLVKFRDSGKLWQALASAFRQSWLTADKEPKRPRIEGHEGQKLGSGKIIPPQGGSAAAPPEGK